MKYMGKEFKGFGTSEFDRAYYEGRAKFYGDFDYENKNASPGAVYNYCVYAYTLDGKYYLDVVVNYRNNDGKGFNYVAYVAEFDSKAEANQHFKRITSAIYK